MMRKTRNTQSKKFILPTNPPTLLRVYILNPIQNDADGQHRKDISPYVGDKPN